MTKEEFLRLDWDDSHIGYDMQVGQYRIIAYITYSNKYPGCLCLVAGDKEFPVINSGCGFRRDLRNPCPADVIKILKTNSFERVITIMDGVAYDLKPGAMYVNGIDSEVLFICEETPYTSGNITKDDNEDFNIDEI